MPSATKKETVKVQDEVKVAKTSEETKKKMPKEPVPDINKAMQNMTIEEKQKLTNPDDTKKSDAKPAATTEKDKKANKPAKGKK